MQAAQPWAGLSACWATNSYLDPLTSWPLRSRLLRRRIFTQRAAERQRPVHIRPKARLGVPLVLPAVAVQQGRDTSGRLTAWGHLTTRAPKTTPAPQPPAARQLARRLRARPARPTKGRRQQQCRCRARPATRRQQAAASPCSGWRGAARAAPTPARGRERWPIGDGAGDGARRPMTDLGLDARGCCARGRCTVRAASVSKGAVCVDDLFHVVTLWVSRVPYR